MRHEVYSYHRDVEDAHWWFVGRRRILKPLIDHCMAGHGGDQIVDVGCGTGGTVAALSRQYDCIGLDHSEPAIAMARQKYPSCRFECGDLAERLHALAGRTALFTLMDVLEHIDDDRAFLATVVAAARPGSHILITVPAHRSLWSEHDVAADHKRRYEEDDLRRAWQGLDVTPRLMSFFNARLYPAIWCARQLGRHVGLFSGRGGRDLAIPAAPINALLTRVFSGERDRIGDLLDNPSARPYAWGSSLVAVLRKAGAQ